MLAFVPCCTGFTSQYSNHETSFEEAPVLVMVTSCRSTGSSPNGAYTYSSALIPSAWVSRRA